MDVVVPDLLFKRSFGEEPFKNIHGVDLSNMVMHLCLKMPSTSRRMRSLCGVPVTPSSKKTTLRCPTSQFACSQICPHRYPGMIMRYNQSEIRVGRATQAISLCMMLMYTVNSGNIWPTGINVPNSVATVYFKRPIGVGVKKSPRAEKTKKISHIRMIIHSPIYKTRTINVHLGFCQKTGKQNRSSCTIPGTRTAKELREYVNIIQQEVSPYYI